jgi:hypothetical protein
MRGSPYSTGWASATQILVTLPARGAWIGFIVFMASTIRIVCPSVTESPDPLRRGVMLRRRLHHRDDLAGLPRDAELQLANFYFDFRQIGVSKDRRQFSNDRRIDVGRGF